MNFPKPPGPWRVNGPAPTHCHMCRRSMPTFQCMACEHFYCVDDLRIVSWATFHVKLLDDDEAEAIASPGAAREPLMEPTTKDRAATKVICVGCASELRKFDWS